MNVEERKKKFGTILPETTINIVEAMSIAEGKEKSKIIEEALLSLFRERWDEYSEEVKRFLAVRLNLPVPTNPANLKGLGAPESESETSGLTEQFIEHSDLHKEFTKWHEKGIFSKRLANEMLKCLREGYKAIRPGINTKPGKPSIAALLERRRKKSLGFEKPEYANDFIKFMTRVLDTYSEEEIEEALKEAINFW